MGKRVKHLVRTTLAWERTPSLLSRMKGCQNHDFTLWVMCRYSVILYYCFESRKQKVGQCQLPRPFFFLLLCIFLGNFSRNNGASELLCCLQSASHAGPGLLSALSLLQLHQKSMENARQLCEARDGSLAAKILVSFRRKS